MKRSELRRLTPMRRSGPPNRKNPPKKKSKNLRKPAPDGGFWAEQRTVIFLRARGWCERCGADLNATGMEAHHRQLRSQGGGHGLENLLALCPDCHRRCHSYPVEARANGWIVPSGGDPGARAVLLFDGRTVRLTDEGNYDVIWNDETEEATG